jgi:hypothetical protein
VQSYYVSNGNVANPTLEEFYSRLRANNEVDDKGRLLNLKHKENLVLSLCIATMTKVADKNPDGGDQVQLRLKAEEIRKR